MAEFRGPDNASSTNPAGFSTIDPDPVEDPSLEQSGSLQSSIENCGSDKQDDNLEAIVSAQAVADEKQTLILETRKDANDNRDNINQCVVQNTSASAQVAPDEKTEQTPIIEEISSQNVASGNQGNAKNQHAVLETIDSSQVGTIKKLNSH
jgi:hypothetical protein